MTLLFDDNSITETYSPLIRCLRTTCYEKKITEAAFKKLYYEWAARQGRTDDPTVPFDFDHDLKHIQNNNATPSLLFFERIMRIILGIAPGTQDPPIDNRVLIDRELLSVLVDSLNRFQKFQTGGLI